MIRTFNSEILEFKNLNPSVIKCKFSTPKDFTFKAGQYISLTVPIDGKKLRRPYSIASKPNGKGFIEMCVKIVDGPASEFIKTLKKGDEVELFGPAGKFVIDESSLDKDLIFISAGTGLTPFLSMIPDLLEHGFKKRIILLKGFWDEENILYEDELLELQKKYSNFEFYNILSRPKNETYKDKGYVQHFIEKYIPKNFQGHIYICGLSDMIDSVREKMISLEVPEDIIFYEKYD